MVNLKRVEIIGGGPAGLYVALLLKRKLPDATIRVTEQNSKGATFGFGVVFSDRALDFLKHDDPAIHRLITPHMQRWENITLNHPAGRVTLDGVGFASIGRLELIEMLRKEAEALGVNIRFGTVVQSLQELSADLIVGADGLNSLVRQFHADQFEVSVDYSCNHFAWYGAEVRFETLTQTFINTKKGPLNAHHYRYSPHLSTFIVECGDEVFRAYQFDDMGEDKSASVCAEVFSEVLEGRPLITNKSNWRQFPRIWCNKWVTGNIALVGDAAHTAHFSVGSGTRLALEDAIALVGALSQSTDLETALANYSEVRQPIAKKIVDAANSSAKWYETFGDKMNLAPLDFGHDYLNRSGRMDSRRLRKVAPLFMAKYDQHRNVSA